MDVMQMLSDTALPSLKKAESEEQASDRRIF